MAKIPRIDQGNRPSSVVGLPAVDTSASGAFSILGDVSDSILTKVMAAKQEIVDTIDAGGRSLAFEDDLRLKTDELKNRFANSPEDAIKAFQKSSEELVKSHVFSTDNPRVQQELAKTTTSAVKAEQEQLFKWISARQTQKSRETAATLENAIPNGITRFTSADAAADYLDARIEKERPILALAYGEKEAEERIKKIKEQGAALYGEIAARNNPRQLMSEVETSRLFTSYASAAKRAELPADAQRGYANRQANIDFQLAVKAAGDTDRLAALVGTPDFVQTAFKQKQALESAMLNIDGDPSIKPADKPAKKSVIKKQIATLEALKRIDAAGRAGNVTDNIDTLRELYTRQAELFPGGKKKNKGIKELDALLSQMNRISQAADNQLISQSSFRSLFDDCALAYKTIMEKEEGNTGSWWRASTAHQVGIEKINTLFDTDFKNLSADKKYFAYERFSKARQKWTDDHLGMVMDNTTAEKLAMQSVSEATGTNVGAR